jgi:DUF1016 N-terminal domain
MTGPAPIRRSDALPADYPQFLAEIKARIAGARTRAALAVNGELVRLYWEIGHEILEREQREGWGARVIDRLAADLRREFPDMTGLSLRNLRYMRAFAPAWPAEGSSPIVQQVVAQLPWGHNVTLLGGDCSLHHGRGHADPDTAAGDAAGAPGPTRTGQRAIRHRRGSQRSEV